jgi:hypothetical protein
VGIGPRYRPIPKNPLPLDASFICGLCYEEIHERRFFGGLSARISAFHWSSFTTHHTAAERPASASKGRALFAVLGGLGLGLAPPAGRVPPLRAYIPACGMVGGGGVGMGASGGGGGRREQGPSPQPRPRAGRRPQPPGDRGSADQRISGGWWWCSHLTTSHGGAEARREQREEPTTGPRGQLERASLVLLPVVLGVGTPVVAHIHCRS